jgi:beta-apo-4'-carotenal oxygenase
MKENEDAIIEACKKDLGKPIFETSLGETWWCTNDIVFVMNNLEKWMKDEKAPDIDFTNSIVSPKFRKDPLGCVLIIG